MNYIQTGFYRIDINGQPNKIPYNQHDALTFSASHAQYSWKSAIPLTAEHRFHQEVTKLLREAFFNTFMLVEKPTVTSGKSVIGL